MSAPDTAFVKQWARIDGTEFDAILPTLIDSATALAGHATGKDYFTVTMPEPVQQWCAATVSYWISSPDAATERPMIPAPFLAALLDPYREFA